jgi:peptide/nickel transport system substrate-binding protein
MLTTALVLAVAAGVPAVQAKNTLRWASQGDALTADPHAQNEGPTNNFNLTVHEALVYRDRQMKLEPALALSWKPINPTTWEFKLRQNVTFHDGSKFTADDVVFTFQRAQLPTSDHRNSLDTIAEIKKVDDHTVHFVTKAPNPILPNQITQISVMSKAWAEKHKVEKPQDYKNKEETYAVRNANGTGPFKIKKRDPGVETILERNQAWWGWKAPQGGGNIDEIVYKPIKNAPTRVAALLSGEIDFVLDPPVQDLDNIRKNDKLKVLEVAQDRSIFLGMDQGRNELRSSDVKGKNPFAEKKVRQAINLAVDRDTIKRVVMRGLSAPAGIITAPAITGHTKELDTPPKANVDAAKKLLAEAGYPNGFSVKLDCPNDRYNNDEQICQAVVGMLAKVGIKVQLDAQSKTLHFPKIQKRETDFYLLGWGVPTFDSHYVFNFLYQSKGSWNATGYKAEKIDQLTLAMAGEVDLKKREGLIAQAWKQAKDDVVYIPLHHQVIAWGMSKKLDMPIFMNDQPQFRYAKMGK